MRCLNLVALLCLGSGLAGCGEDNSLRISSGVAANNLVRRVNPVYPAEAKERHVSGAVVLSVLVDEQGNVAEVTPVSGPELLRPAYVEAVRQWKYKPFERDGFPLTMRTTISIVH